MIRKIGFFILGVILVLGLAACNNGSEVNNSSELEGSIETEDIEKALEKTIVNLSNYNEIEKVEISEGDLFVGDTVDFDGLEITLNEVRIEQGGEYDTKINDQFVVANLTITNTTDEDKEISSKLSIELKDEDGYLYSPTYLSEGIRGNLQGSLIPGETLRGEVPFDVPNSEKYELQFSYFSKLGKAIWTIPSSELNLKTLD